MAWVPPSTFGIAVVIEFGMTATSRTAYKGALGTLRTYSEGYLCGISIPTRTYRQTVVC